MGKQRHRNTNKNSARNEYKQFASVSVTRTGVTGTASRSIDESQLKTMLQNPRNNADSIASVSKGMKQTNGAYKNMIRYFSSILTFDHTMYPVMEDPLSFATGNNDLQVAFAEAAVLLDRFNIKFNLPIFTNKIFTKGVAYLYKMEDTAGIAFQELPLSSCRISYMEEGVYRYQFNIADVTDDTFYDFPDEIQRAYEVYRNGNADSLELEDQSWYQLSDLAVAFTLDEDALTQGGAGAPPLATGLLDAIRIENAKNAMESSAELDNVKIIHSKIKTDDRGRPLMEMPAVMEFHNSLKRNLPDGVVAITNPFDTDSVALGGNGDVGKKGRFALIGQATENFHRAVGVSPDLFASPEAPAQVLEKSILVDIQWVLSLLLPMYTNYFDYELRRAGEIGGAIWKIKFLQTSFFFRGEAIETARDQLSWGGSRLEYLATTGMTPLEVANMLIFEQRTLNIDDFMIAKQNAHTLSSDDQEGGRPESDNPTETTTRIRESQ